MAIVIPNAGEVKVIGLALGKDTQENLITKLYTNDYTPIKASTASNFTEASGSGYSAHTVIPGDWAVTSGTPTDAATSDLVYSFTGALGAVYGYYVVGAVSGTIYWAERFNPAPITIQYTRDQIRIPLQITIS